MLTKDFVPARLPVLPDSSLLRTLFEYRYALQLLSGSGQERQRVRQSGSVRRVEQDVREAVSALEAEVRSRGLEGPLDEVGRFLSARLTRKAA